MAVIMLLIGLELIWKISAMNRFSRYAGNKLHFTDMFNEITEPLNKKIYVEPFFGSGAIFFNLNKEYDLYVINDLNKHVMNTVAAFKNSDYETYKNLYDKMFAQFGDIKNNKQSYYDFRNWFNAEYFSKNTDLITEGILFHFLMNACINSLIRIGPNGFNQSYGNRFLFLEKSEFDAIQKRLNRNVVILSEDYKDVISKYDSEDTLLFLDPPYFLRNEVGYEKTYSESDLISFIDKIKTLKSSIVYTDIPCHLHDKLKDWHREDTKTLISISPNRDSELANQEVFYSNFAPAQAVIKNPTLFD